MGDGEMDGMREMREMRGQGKQGKKFLQVVPLSPCPMPHAQCPSP